MTKKDDKPRIFRLGNLPPKNKEEPKTISDHDFGGNGFSIMAEPYESTKDIYEELDENKALIQALVRDNNALAENLSSLSRDMSNAWMVISSILGIFADTGMDAETFTYHFEKRNGYAPNAHFVNKFFDNIKEDDQQIN